MNPRRYPRTLNEAFGPYASGPIEAPQDPMPTADCVVCWVAVVAVAALAVMAWAGAL